MVRSTAEVSRDSCASTIRLRASESFESVLAYLHSYRLLKAWPESDIMQEVDFALAESYDDLIGALPLEVRLTVIVKNHIALAESYDDLIGALPFRGNFLTTHKVV